MKKTILLVGMVAALMSVSYDVFTNSGGAPDGSAGIPGEGSCAQCHSGVVNSGPGTLAVSFNGGATSYIGGRTYPVTVTLTQASISKFGFQSSFVNSASAGVGTLSSSTSAGKAQVSRSYITHTSSGSAGNGSASWSFNWTAPAAGTGTVKLYTAGNATNSNSATNGDRVYTNVLTLTESSTSSVSTAEIKPLALYPSVNNGSFDVQSVESVPAEVSIKITDLTGKVVFSKTSNQKTGAYFESFQLNLTPGVYTATLMHGAVMKASKMIVQ